MTYSVKSENPTFVKTKKSTRLCLPITLGTQTFTNVAYNYRAVRSGNSPRVNGKLQLKDNWLEFRKIQANQPPTEILFSYETTDPCNQGTGSFWFSADSVPNSSLPTKYQPGLPNTYDDEAYLKAVQAFYDDLNEIKVNAAVAFKERQQTIDLVASRARKIAQLYRSLRRGYNPFTRKKSRSKDAANLWLEYSYGWVPLVSDVYGSIEALKGEPPKFSHKITRQADLQYRHSFIGGTNHSSFESNNTLTSTKKLRCTVKAICTVNDPSASFSRSLGLRDPLLLAWEILPYSFVVDWFLPIGPWLEAQNATSGLSFSSASVTRTCLTSIQKSSTISVRSYAASSVNSSGGQCRGTWIQKNKRRKLGVPSYPLPRLQNPLSIRHAITSLALLRQAFS